MPLENQQKNRALEVLREYLDAPKGASGLTRAEESAKFVPERIQLIEDQLKPLVEAFLNGDMSLDDFKTKIDSLNKRYPLWGFKGIKGQMFFNMLLKVAADVDELDQELKTAIAVPASDKMASSRIRTFTSYVKRLGQEWVEAGNSKYGQPRVFSIPFFLSYFWQLQDRDTWPVYYTSSVQTMTDINIWQPSDDLVVDYLAYKSIHEELVELFTKESGRPFDLYQVEHVFWFKGGNALVSMKTEELDGSATAIVEPRLAPEQVAAPTILPESYIPPIIAILPRIARHEPSLEVAAKRSGTTLDRAFEKNVDAAFTVLGYETKLLGQGQGRVPDGLAKAIDEQYAIIWDAKIRADGYSMGTDDRTIREYIASQAKSLKKSALFRNMYYAIVSSSFKDDFDDTIRSLKMETYISEVILIEADALVEMVDARLRSPLQISLGPDGLQRLFSLSGILTANKVREEIL